MRADSPSRLISAIERLTRLITTDNPDPRPYLVEEYLPSIEVALEGMLNRGALTVLALFDKPDPLEGPFFKKETILCDAVPIPVGTQTAIEATTAAAAGHWGWYQARNPCRTAHQ